MTEVIISWDDGTVEDGMRESIFTLISERPFGEDGTSTPEVHLLTNDYIGDNDVGVILPGNHIWVEQGGKIYGLPSAKITSIRPCV